MLLQSRAVELALNLLWAAIAVLAIGGCVRQAFPGEGGRSRRALILACALFLFYPALSITDDLHAASRPMEESNVSLRKASGSALTQALAVLFAISALFVPSFRATERTEESRPLSPLAVAIVVADCRAPPSS
jgi:hypothetical protein